MTAFVTAIKPTWDANDKFQGHSVFYGTHPELRFASRAAAMVHRDFLHHSEVQANLHVCSFAIEEVRDGEFAIACPTHPA